MLLGFVKLEQIQNLEIWKTFLKTRTNQESGNINWDFHPQPLSWYLSKHKALGTLLNPFVMHVHCSAQWVGYEMWIVFNEFHGTNTKDRQKDTWSGLYVWCFCMLLWSTVCCCLGNSQESRCMFLSGVHLSLDISSICSSCVSSPPQACVWVYHYPRPK